MDNYQPYAIYLMAEKFVGGREKTTDEDFKLTQDQFINKFESQGFYKIETAGKSRRATAADSGQRHPRMLFLIISETGRYFNKTSDFIRLVQTNKWDEAAVIVPRSFFLKKNFMSKVQELFREGKREGRHLGVYPYAIFTIEIPKHESVPSLLNSTTSASPRSRPYTTRIRPLCGAEVGRAISSPSRGILRRPANPSPSGWSRKTPVSGLTCTAEFCRVL
jgi:hypothetical protein